MAAVLTPPGDKYICVQEFPVLFTFQCMTDTGALLWVQRWDEEATSPMTVYRRSTSRVNDMVSVGFFETKVTDIDGDNLTSIATINTSSLLNISTTTTTVTLVCDDTGDAKSDVNASLIILNGTHLALLTSLMLTCFFLPIIIVYTAYTTK